MQRAANQGKFIFHFTKHIKSKLDVRICTGLRTQQSLV